MGKSVSDEKDGKFEERVLTGIKYRMTFLRLSKTRRPDSIATGIDWKSLFRRIKEALII